MSYDPNFPPPPTGAPSQATPPPIDPLGGSPPPLDQPISATAMTEGTGLPRNIAAALACVFLLFGGVIFYILDRKDRFVRLYALESIVLGGVFFVIGLVLQFSMTILHYIPLIGPLINGLLYIVWLIAGIVFLILWVLLIWNAYRGKLWEMPFLWAFAKKHIPAALL